MVRNYNIALIGLGNIGSYLYNYLKKNKKLLIERNNISLTIKYVAVKNLKKKRKIKIDKKLIVKNYLDIVKKTDVDVIIELIGGADGAAKNLVFAALKNKKHVVTANKALIAKYGDQLAKIAETNKVNLEYEAAVCGGVPIIRTLKEGLLANSIKKIYGIYNGTTNFILSKMDYEKFNYKTSLKIAQSLGYAESKPDADINGSDVAAKLNILSALSFNSLVEKNIIYVEGIKNIDSDDIQYANTLGYKIKLLGIAEQINNQLYQRVHPCLVDSKSYIANISGVLNAVIIESNPVGTSIIQGEGAGPKATTSALVSDIASIARGNIKQPFMIPTNKRKKINYKSINELRFSYYLRFDVKDKFGVLSKITNILSKNKISIKRLIQNPNNLNKNASIVLVTHTSLEANMQKALKTLTNLKYVNSNPKMIRIETV